MVNRAPAGDAGESPGRPPGVDLTVHRAGPDRAGPGVGHVAAGAGLDRTSHGGRTTRRPEDRGSGARGGDSVAGDIVDGRAVVGIDTVDWIRNAPELPDICLRMAAQLESEPDTDPPDRDCAAPRRLGRAVPGHGTLPHPANPASPQHSRGGVDPRPLWRHSPHRPSRSGRFSCWCPRAAPRPVAWSPSPVRCRRRRNPAWCAGPGSWPQAPRG